MIIRRCYYFVWAYLGVVAIHRELHRGGFAAARKHFLKTSGRGACSTALDQRLLNDIEWAVEEACKWQRQRSDCLHRALICYHLLQTIGANPIFIIAARSRPFESHAWVVINDLVIADTEVGERRSQYKVLLRVPEVNGFNMPKEPAEGLGTKSVGLSSHVG